MDPVTILISGMIGFVLGEVIYWCVIGPLIDRQSRVHVFRPNKRRIMVFIHKNGVVVTEYRKKGSFVSMDGRMFKACGSDILVYADDEMRPIYPIQPPSE